MDKIERLINLTAYLLDTEHPLTLDDLRDTVYRDQTSGSTALRRMFERDKEELRDMGVEVKTVSAELEDEVGYTIDRDDYYLPHLDLTLDERLALTMVSRLFLGSGTPFSGPAHSALLKFAFEEEVKGLSEDQVPHVHWVGAPSERKALSIIIDGLTRRKLLSFSYMALDAREPVERDVEPYGVFSRHGSWYLVGQCHLRGETRCFKLERIISQVEVNQANPRSPDFEVPEGFDVETEARWEWPTEEMEKEVEARVRFSPRLAFAHTNVRAPVLSTERAGDGFLEVTYGVTDPEQFVGWILEFGRDAVILAPPRLRKMAVERLDGVLAASKGVNK